MGRGAGLPCTTDTPDPDEDEAEVEDEDEDDDDDDDDAADDWALLGGVMLTTTPANGSSISSVLAPAAAGSEPRLGRDPSKGLGSGAADGFCCDCACCKQQTH